MKRRVGFVMLACTLVAVPAAAQRFEAAPLTIATHSTSSSIEQQAPGVSDLKIDNGFAWTAQGAYFLTSSAGVEVWWRRQNTAVSLASASSSVALFYMQTNDLDANVVYQLAARAKGIVPFVSGGAGVTFLSADTLDNESRFAWNVGGGAKWFFLRNLGARFDARYRATRLNTSPSDYCSPLRFCQGSLKTFLVGVGAELRF